MLCETTVTQSHIRLECSESGLEWKTALYKSSSHQYGNICLFKASNRQSEAALHETGEMWELVDLFSEVVQTFAEKK